MRKYEHVFGLEPYALSVEHDQGHHKFILQMAIRR